MDKRIALSMWLMATIVLWVAVYFEAKELMERLGLLEAVQESHQ